MIFKSFKVENFRAFKKLEIENLRDVNLIVGKNGVGKTTLLEALFLLAGRKNPQCSIKVQNFRNIFISTDEDFQSLYNNFKFDKSIFISSTLNSKKIVDLTIEPIFKYKQFNSVGQKLIDQKNMVLSPQDTGIYGLRYLFRDLDDKDFKLEFSIQQPVPPFPYRVDFPTYFLNVNTMQNSFEAFDTIINNKNEQEIISILKNMDERVQDLRMGKNNTMLVYIEGIDKAVPLNIMGYGMNRAVSIISVIENIKNGILLLDEIDNGLHYTSLKSLLISVFTACKKNNVQLFVTTHSQDCIKNFIEIVKNENFKDMANIMRLSKRNEEHFVTNYSDDKLDIVYDEDLEIR